MKKGVGEWVNMSRKNVFVVCECPQYFGFQNIGFRYASTLTYTFLRAAVLHSKGILPNPNTVDTNFKL